MSLTRECASTQLAAQTPTPSSSSVLPALRATPRLPAHVRVSYPLTRLLDNILDDPHNERDLQPEVESSLSLPDTHSTVAVRAGLAQVILMLMLIDSVVIDIPRSM